MMCTAGTVLLQGDCMYVCLSVTIRYSVETAKHILKLFSSPGSHTILVFFLTNGVALFRQGPQICKGFVVI